MPGAGTIEYRLARLRERLADGPLAELGLRIELRGESVALSGTVASPESRDEVLAVAEEELDDLPVISDLVVAGAQPPGRPEELG
jgi:hypothetical protein